MLTNITKLTACTLLGASVLLSAGCATKVTRLSANEEVALSDRWNAKDSELVANEMITDMLSFPWARDFEMDNNRRPTVIISRISNKSHEHIAVDTFINDIKRSIIRSGRAGFVAGGDERDAVRDERRDQELNAKNAKAQGQEKAADFALSGTINSLVDQVGKERVTFYQVDLKLIDMESNMEVWNGQKKIQKLQQKSSFGF
ncbi:MAG: penicillin-binding protein activator LpoB [Thalassobium sp.]|uniref:Penicillin-binding protein activator LpoB n=1 Tax=Thalassolituus pacificus TaxID=2975440 RepID=A0A9X2WFR8_9GAMM|nr:penicillin-binding protein activator LpoB [Thalassolituus pacificus]MCT7359260.1 penicillin-binding protein activator LpoB [Thalassolituus pacificus]PHS65142.1 MAG: penicillin-binding protein activator LpoB [Thalassobium sp.]